MSKKNDNKFLDKPKDRVKEVVGKEIELKLTYCGRYGDRIFNELKHVFDNSDYRLVEGLDSLSWIFNFDYFGCWENCKPTRLFILIYHPSTKKFWFRRKGDYSGGLSRSEETIVFEKTLSRKIRQELIKQEESRVGKKVVLIGRIVREKRYFMVESVCTSRTYAIAIDRCRFEKNKLSQLEVEYKWTRKNLEIDKNVIQEQIFLDMEKMKNLILNSNVGSLFTPTDLTKWEWLIGLRNKDED